MKAIPLLLIILCSLGCSKQQAEQKQLNLVLQVMVNGQWKVSSYMKGNADSTVQFSGYSFQFRENLTVDATKNGTFTATGTWNGQASPPIINSFFTNTNSTLLLLNGTWNILNTGLTYVIASQTTNGELCTLRLDKL